MSPSPSPGHREDDQVSSLTEKTCGFCLHMFASVKQNNQTVCKNFSIKTDICMSDTQDLSHNCY